MLEEIYNSEVVYLRSKDKRNGWNNFGSSAVFKNGQSYYADRHTDPRIIAYHKGNLIMRLACHDCKFRKLPRAADITLSDFWGIEKSEKNPNLEFGTSAVLLNSQKGKDFFLKVSDRIDTYPKKLVDVLKGNPLLFTNPKIGKNRDKFFRELDYQRFDKLVARYRHKNTIYKRIFSTLKKRMKRIM